MPMSAMKQTSEDPLRRYLPGLTPSDPALFRFEAGTWTETAIPLGAPGEVEVLVLGAVKEGEKEVER